MIYLPATKRHPFGDDYKYLRFAYFIFIALVDQRIMDIYNICR
jgi:hypothetical protein